MALVPDLGSTTARGVAIARAVGIGAIRDPLVADLLPSTDRVVVQTLSRLPAARPAIGMTAHAALRMHAIDRAIGDAVQTLASPTVVIVGAGWDTRAWRLEALRGRDVVEVDLPATQRAKRARLGRLPAPLASVHFAAVDLGTDDLGAALDVAGQDPAQPVVWIWEAVAPYLPPEAVDETLAVLARRTPAGSRLLLTTFTPALVTPSLGPLAFAARVGLAGAGEPVLTAETDAAVTARLARHGWIGDGGSDAGDWAVEAGVQVYGPRFDEHLHVATRDGGTA